MLDNADLAELLAEAAKEAEGVRQQALKRATRAAFMWPEQAADLLTSGRTLTELHGIGPSLAKRLTEWIEDPPPRAIERDPLRLDFLTLANARAALSEKPQWSATLRGDLHMHSTWSDGSGTIAEMAAAGAARGYDYIAITDHTKGLSIAGGINEEEVAEQALEIADVNAASSGTTVLHSVELNLNPPRRRRHGPRLPREARPGAGVLSLGIAQTGRSDRALPRGEEWLSHCSWNRCTSCDATGVH